MKVWTKEEVEFLKQNYNQPIPLEEISKDLGRSKVSVKHKAQRMNLNREWIRFNKPLSNQSRGITDQRYYQNNREKIDQRKITRRKELKKEMVKIAGGKCKNCGYNKCHAALEFHHYEKNKEGNVSTLMKNESRQKLLKEAEKCILLCANCHRELHFTGASYNGLV